MERNQLLSEIIVPTLKYLEMDSPASRNLLLGTAAQESHMGKYIRQIKGPALGIYQMEPATHDDIWENYLAYRPSLVKKLNQLLCPGFDNVEQLIWNLKYATAMARIHYRRVPKPLPEPEAIGELALYWKAFYNTFEGKGTVVEFKHNYQRFVL